MLRFAPTPTGDFLLGDLRIALLTYIVAKQRGEEFIVRFDDLDQTKGSDEQDNEILDILSLFNLTYSQVLHQTQHLRFYSAMALQLLHEKKAFSCFCSKEWLEKKRQEAQEAHKPYLYDDACRNLPAELVIDNENPFSVRVTRADKDIVVDDLLQNPLTFAADELDSFKIMNYDKTPTYNFAAAVDDMLNDISFIVRDLSKSSLTPKQEHIRDALAYEKKITYLHLSPLQSSPEQNISIKWFFEQGYLPSAILNYLVSLGFDGDQEIFTIEDAIAFFDLEKLQNTPLFFDIEKLNKINKMHLLKLDPKELSRYVGFADTDIGNLARLFLEKICTTKELKAKIEPIFSKRNTPEDIKEEVEAIIAALQNAPYFEHYEDFLHHVIQKTQLTQEQLEKPLRFVLINSDDSVDLAQVYQYLKNYLGEIIK